MKKTTCDRKNILRGVSTLDVLKRSLRIVLILLIFTALNGAIYGGHSILDLVDPSFNPQILTNSFTPKDVSAIVIQPDGKILIAGNFNSYNRQLVSRVVRLNADATLDTTFNSPTFEAGVYPNKMILQADGKITLRGYNMVLTSQPQSVKQLIRLNADGTLDSTFNYNGEIVVEIAIDASGRILCSGNFPQNNINRKMIRLNTDGSEDSSFHYAAESVSRFATQNNKVIIYIHVGSQAFVKRLNEDGTADTSFTMANLNGFGVTKFIVQPDGKILVLDALNLRRLNENGGGDSGFTPTNFPPETRTMDLSDDGRITVAIASNSLQQQVLRFLPNGLADSSFTTYNSNNLNTLAVQSDGGVIIGDSYLGGSGTTIPNNFSRLLPNGMLDTTFNSGGIGFQNLTPGAVRAIAVQPDGKVLIGGKFDSVNEASRFKMARLNTDSTLDLSFQIDTGGTGNSFTQIHAIYNIVLQADGKIIISGSFIYMVNGEEERNVVRLNPNGTIDSTFNLNIRIDDVFSCCNAGTNRIALLSNGKLLVGTSRNSVSSTLPIPLKLNADGTRDTSFNSTVLSTQNLAQIHDLAIQPDGKIIIGGRHETAGITKSFLMRLNPDGSLDTTFQIREITNKVVNALSPLSNGKILLVEGDSAFQPVQADVLRLNSDGSIDSSFDAGTGVNGKINALLLLPTGKMFVGGKFTTFNGQPRQNLAQLNADGSLNATLYNLDNEVLSLAADSDGRVLVGGIFTVINAGNGSANRSYIARLIDSALLKTHFDFDGDGRSDLGVFTLDGDWTILNSQNNQAVSTHFGLGNDKTIPADFDGDGRTDLAVFRPSEGIWYLLSSQAGFSAVRWGTDGDKPVAGDYDGDGRADLAVWRPSDSVWYILQSANNQPLFIRFGLNGDIPIPRADFDGDNKSDIAVWRPSDGNFYWLASGSGNQFRVVHFGTNGDIPAVADYNGDGKTDLVVYRPTEGNWYQYLTTPSGDYIYSVIRFGLNGDVPVPADYNGDGRADIAIWRQGTWHFLMSNQSYVVADFGGANVQAVAAMPNP